MNSSENTGDRILHYVGKSLAWTYDKVLGSSDRARAEKRVRKLCCDVEKAWSRLLALHPAHISPEASPDGEPHFDYAMCIVSFQDFRFRIIQGRSETRVQIAAPCTPGKWQELSTALLTCLGEHRSIPADSRLELYGTVLLKYWERLIECSRNSAD